MLRLFGLALVATLALVAPASAHIVAGEPGGFAHGLMHPLGGIDHVLAMIAVGLLAARLGGRALWPVPLSFVAMMAVGGALGLVGIGLPLVEIAVGLSVVVLGLAVALRLHLPTAAAMMLVGLFAVFHGHAHGAEMPAAAAALPYAAGFVLATALLHAVGIALGLVAGRRGGVRLVQAAGSAMAAVGVAILAGYV